MLVEEVAASIDLILVQLSNKLQVYLGGLTCRGSLAVIWVPGLAKSLPSAELVALGGTL